jgi:hypothetical protein
VTPTDPPCHTRYPDVVPHLWLLLVRRNGHEQSTGTYGSRAAGEADARSLMNHLVPGRDRWHLIHECPGCLEWQSESGYVVSVKCVKQ